MNIDTKASFPKEITIGDKYGPAMAITDPREAAAYFERCVAHTMATFDKPREKAEEIERWNIGYWAGYYDDATRARVEDLFGAQHPVFGSSKKDLPSPETILARGAMQALLVRRAGDCTPTAASLHYCSGPDAMPAEIGDGICVASIGKNEGGGAQLALFWTDSTEGKTRHTVMLRLLRDVRLLEAFGHAIEQVVADSKKGEPSQYLIEFHTHDGAVAISRT